MKRIRTLILALTMLLAGQAAAQNLAEIDAMREAGKYRQAIAALDQLRKATPSDAEVLWRLARTRVDLGEQLGPGKDQEAAYNAAMADATAAVKADPKSADAYLTLAIANGRVGLISGTKRKVELSRDVKQNVDRALQLNPRLGVAYHVRARWNYEVASLGFMEKAVVKVVYGGLPNASYQAAANDFKKAIQFEDSVINHLELGRTYLKLGDKAAAKVEFNKAIAMQASDPDDAGHKAEARKLVARL